MHHADLVHVLPELEFTGIRTYLLEVALEKELAILDLRGVFVGISVYVVVLFCTTFDE
jgi:hypothetical protein